MTNVPANDEFTKNLLDSLWDAVDSDVDISDSGVRFDLWAKPLEAFEWAKEYIPGLIVTSAGGFFPYQAEGYINGYPFYYRSEQGGCSVKIGDPEDGMPYLWDESLWLIADDEFEGSTHETFIEGMTRLLPRLEKTPYLYKFPCHHSNFVGENGTWLWEIDETQTSYVQGIGHTIDEAWKQAQEPSSYLAEHGFELECQTEYFWAKNPDPVPFPHKLRNYQSPEPVFHSKPFYHIPSE